jgi:hypothetical protein
VYKQNETLARRVSDTLIDPYADLVCDYVTVKDSVNKYDKVNTEIVWLFAMAIQLSATRSKQHSHIAKACVSRISPLMFASTPLPEPSSSLSELVAIPILMHSQLHTASSATPKTQTVENETRPTADFL